MIRLRDLLASNSSPRSVLYERAVTEIIVRDDSPESVAKRIATSPELVVSVLDYLRSAGGYESNEELLRDLAILGEGGKDDLARNAYKVAKHTDEDSDITEEDIRDLMDDLVDALVISEEDVRRAIRVAESLWQGKGPFPVDVVLTLLKGGAAAAQASYEGELRAFAQRLQEDPRIRDLIRE